MLEAPKLITEKAADMLRHYISAVLPNGFKSQVVAVSRLAAIRYRDALEEARNRLAQEIEASTPESCAYRTKNWNERTNTRNS